MKKQFPNNIQVTRSTLSSGRADPKSDNTWTTKAELQQQDPNLLEHYHDFISPDAKSPQRRGIDVDIRALYQRTRAKLVFL